MMTTRTHYALIIILAVLLSACTAGSKEGHGWEQVPEILAAIREPSFPEKKFNVLDYGAISDGTHDSKAAIDEAILDCAKLGGGTVLFPKGNYLIQGPVHLENNIRLHLEEGARLLFGDNPDDYLPEVLTSWEGTRLYNYSSFIYAREKHNIAIKAGRDFEGRTLQKPSRNIFIRNCFFHGHNALAVGSEMSGGVYNVFVENCTSEGDVRNGIYLKSNKDRGGKIADIYMRNISFGNVNTLIRIEPDYKGEGEFHPPVFENIFLENISAQNAAEYGIYIMGSAESPVRNVLLKGIRINRASTSALIKYTTGVNMSNVQIY